MDAVGRAPLQERAVGPAAAHRAYRAGVVAARRAASTAASRSGGRIAQETNSGAVSRSSHEGRGPSGEGLVRVGADDLQVAGAAQPDQVVAGARAEVRTAGRGGDTGAPGEVGDGRREIGSRQDQVVQQGGKGVHRGRA